MRAEYDFSKAKRAADIPHLAKLQAEMKGKTRITIMLDNDVIESFRQIAKKHHTGYQTAINEALRAALDREDVPITVGKLREVLRQELREA